MTLHIRECFRLKNPICKYRNAVKLLTCTRKCTSLIPQSNEIENRNELFCLEQKRRLESVGRIEKITVKVSGPPDDATLFMNKDISTPYDCARHLTDHPVINGALALINSNTLWDMHRPLKSDCELKFLYFDDDDPRPLNKIFWESCSIVLGCIITTAFKDNVRVLLHSYPTPDYRTGSFVYDAQLSLEDWKPTTDELKVLAAEIMKLKHENYKFERLTVDRELALKIMEGNPFKEEQVVAAASKREDGRVTLYKIGNHIDISEGPLMSSTSLISRCSITAVHKLNSNIDSLYRFQGVALPKPLWLNHFAYSIIENRSKKLNPGHIPESRHELCGAVRKDENVIVRDPITC